MLQIDFSFLTYSTVVQMGSVGTKGNFCPLPVLTNSESALPPLSPLTFCQGGWEVKQYNSVTTFLSQHCINDLIQHLNNLMQRYMLCSGCVACTASHLSHKKCHRNHHREGHRSSYHLEQRTQTDASVVFEHGQMRNGYSVREEALLAHPFGAC